MQTGHAWRRHLDWLCAWLISCVINTSRVVFLILAIALLSLAAVAAYRLWLHPLAATPGPRLAAITSCWHAYQARNGRMLHLGKTLHKRYGPVVRIGPNELWFADRDAYKLIYSPTNGYEKSNFYWADFKRRPAAVATALLKPKLGRDLRLQSPDTLDLLAERDMRRYRLQRRLIGPVYHTNNVKQYEYAVDVVLRRVIAHLRALDSTEVDLKEWMHITVVECLGAVSLSWSPGYLRDNSDGASGRHAYMGWRRKSVFGLFPLAVISESLSRSAGRAFATLWRITYHTPKQGFKPFFPAVQKKISQRVKVALRGQPKGDERKDIVADLIRLHKERPEFNEQYLRRMAITNFGAGHETTTSTLISVLAMMGLHGQVQQRVAQEIQQSSDPLGYDAAVQLEFTQASIKEAQRLHPVIGMSLPRTVPKEGMHLHGLHIPPGTTVGCNPVALHRNPEIFGQDAEAYNPARWLKNEIERKEMDRYNLIYGGGARTCPGRHLAEMLVTKITVALIRHFDIKVVMPSEDEVSYYFMAMLTGVKVRFVPRTEQTGT